MNKKISPLIVFLLSFLNNCYAQQTVGLFTQNPGSLNGYVLFAPIPSNTTYLIDKCGYLVHSWTSTHHPGQSVYLLEDGTLLRPGSTGNSVFTSGGNGGIIEKFDWNSNVLWSYTISSPTQCQHHDIKQLPNGNVLAIVWELKTVAEAIAAGRDPGNLGTSFWCDKIVELQPVGNNNANIVWEWHAWDHLIQDFDSTKANYGNVSQHPELLNLNYNGPTFGMATASDWLHCNGLDYNPTLDQVILSTHNLSEVWIIDHSTTTSEAASHSGGVHGKGGDFLYRWGNPEAYGRGTAADKKLFGQHNPRWIENGFTGGGDIMVFNNGYQRPAGNYSTIEIFSPPIDSAGNYAITGNQPYQPVSSWWNYTAPVPTDFYAQVISGAQRLSNGNTIICEGPSGKFFEIDSSKNIVWKYINPVAQGGIISQGNIANMNAAFRCSLYEPSYAGFNGQVLTPGNPIELNPLSYTCNMLSGINESEFSVNDALSIINPFSDNIFIHSSKDLNSVNINLIDITGRMIQEWNAVTLLKNENASLKISSHILAGIYFLNLKNPNQNYTIKLIHQ